MSNLLMDEHPIVVSPKLAAIIGLNESIILQQMHYWLSKSDNVFEGRKWIYNSYAKWQEQFLFWSESTIKRAITSLEKKNLLISGNYNKAGFDKTKWYSINHDVLKLMEAEYDMKKAQEKAEKPVTNRTGQNDPTNVSNCTDGTGQNDPTSISDCTDGTGQVEPTNTIDYQETTTETIPETTTTKSPLQSDEFGKLYQFYEKNMNSYVAPAVAEMMSQDFEDFGHDLVQYAMDEAVMRSKTNYGYVRSILNRCKREGIETREQAELKAASKTQGYSKQKSSYEKTPEWISNPQQPAETKGEVTLEDKLALKKEMYAFEGKEWTAEAEAEERERLMGA